MAKTGDHYTQRGGSIKSFEQGKKKDTLRYDDVTEGIPIPIPRKVDKMV